MSQSLDFKITASNQASRVVGEVQKKVLDFGKDIGRSITAMVGPMAILTLAFGKVMEHMESMKQKAKDAFDWGAGLSNAAAAMGVGVEEFQKFQDIATRTGQSVDNVGKAFKAAGDLIKEAKNGNLEAAESLEALGFNLNELESLKPEDVVGRLGDALASIENPTDKAAAAFAAFGAEGKQLIQTLERIRGLARGPAPEGLTQEEADFLAETKRQEEVAANREKLRIARETATARFLETDAGRQILNRERIKMREAIGGGGGVMGGASPADLITAQSLATNPQIQDEIQGILAANARARAAAEATGPEAIAAGTATAALGKARQEKPTPEPKVKEEKKEVEKVAKAAALTVSSLREIGGGLAGEMTAGEMFAQEMLDYNKRTAEALEAILAQQQPITDFTKPAPEGLVPAFGRRGTMVA